MTLIFSWLRFFD